MPLHSEALDTIKRGKVKEGIRLWRAMFDYEAERPDELTFKRGSQVELISKDAQDSGDDGWWTGKVDDVIGVFPCNFVQEEDDLAAITINYADLVKEQVIGVGGFGKVWKGTWQDMPVAIKEAHRSEDIESAIQSVMQEGRFSRRLEHDNVVKLRGACLEPPNLCLVMDYAAGGCLSKALQSYKNCLPPDILIDWAVQIAKGMEYLHHPQVSLVHRDLKSSNILIKQTLSAEDLDGKCLQISDFGLARQINETTIKSGAGTYAWMAPEVIKSSVFTRGSDVWSYGVVLWELLTGEFPYRGLDPMAVAYGVAMNNFTLPIPSTCPTMFADLMQSCWNPEPKERPSFTEILEQLEDIQNSSLMGGEGEEFYTIQNGWREEIADMFEELKSKEEALRSREDELIREQEALKKNTGELQRKAEMLDERELELLRREVNVIMLEQNRTAAGGLAGLQQGGERPEVKKRKGKSRVTNFLKPSKPTKTHIGHPSDPKHLITVTTNRTVKAGEKMGGAGSTAPSGGHGVSAGAGTSPHTSPDENTNTLRYLHFALNPDMEANKALTWTNRSKAPRNPTSTLVFNPEKNGWQKAPQSGVVSSVQPQPALPSLEGMGAAAQRLMEQNYDDDDADSPVDTKPPVGGLLHPRSGVGGLTGSEGSPMVSGSLRRAMMKQQVNSAMTKMAVVASSVATGFDLTVASLSGTNIHPRLSSSSDVGGGSSRLQPKRRDAFFGAVRDGMLPPQNNATGGTTPTGSVPGVAAGGSSAGLKILAGHGDLYQFTGPSSAGKANTFSGVDKKKPRPALNQMNMMPHNGASGVSAGSRMSPSPGSHHMSTPFTLANLGGAHSRPLVSETPVVEIPDGNDSRGDYVTLDIRPPASLTMPSSKMADKMGAASSGANHPGMSSGSTAPKAYYFVNSASSSSLATAPLSAAQSSVGPGEFSRQTSSGSVFESISGSGGGGAHFERNTTPRNSNHSSSRPPLKNIYEKSPVAPPQSHQGGGMPLYGGGSSSRLSDGSHPYENWERRPAHASTNGDGDIPVIQPPPRPPKNNVNRPTHLPVQPSGQSGGGGSEHRPRRRPTAYPKRQGGAEGMSMVGGGPMDARSRFSPGGSPPPPVHHHKTLIDMEVDGQSRDITRPLLYTAAMSVTSPSIAVTAAPVPPPAISCASLVSGGHHHAPLNQPPATPVRPKIPKKPQLLPK